MLIPYHSICNIQDIQKMSVLVIIVIANIVIITVRILALIKFRKNDTCMK